jgi:hypothetical protein
MQGIHNLASATSCCIVVLTKRGNISSSVSVHAFGYVTIFSARQFVDSGISGSDGIHSECCVY